MRPSLRLYLMAPPSGYEARFWAGVAGLASPAGHPPVSRAHWTTTGPCQVQQLRGQLARQVGLGDVIDRKYPPHLRLAQLARTVAGVHLLEHALLARRAIDDVGVARQRAYGDARAARGVDRHLAGNECNGEVIDGDRRQLGEVQRGFRVTKRPIVRAAVSEDRFDRGLLGAVAPFAVHHADVV